MGILNSSHEAANVCAEDEGGAKRKPDVQGSPGGGSKKSRKARSAQARACVAAANKASEGPQEPSEQAIKGGQRVRLQAHGRLERPSLLLSWVAGLTEDNMREMYEDGWGWDGDAKIDELASAKARYIVASLLPAPAAASPAAAQSQHHGSAAHGESRAAPVQPAQHAKDEVDAKKRPTSPLTCSADNHHKPTSVDSPTTEKKRTAETEGQKIGFWTRLMGRWGSGGAEDDEAQKTAAFADALQQQDAQAQQDEHARVRVGARPVGFVHYR
jgi:hypothetical protein